MRNLYRVIIAKSCRRFLFRIWCRRRSFFNRNVNRIAESSADQVIHLASLCRWEQPGTSLLRQIAQDCIKTVRIILHRLTQTSVLHRTFLQHSEASKLMTKTQLGNTSVIITSQKFRVFILFVSEKRRVSHRLLPPRIFPWHFKASKTQLKNPVSYTHLTLPTKRIV